MKKVVWVLLFIFACAGGAMAAPQQLFLSNDDTESLITLDHGTVAVIELESNPATGYSWRARKPLERNVRIVGSQFESSQSGLLGAPGKEKIYVVGAGKGRSQLVLEYRRVSENTVAQSLKYNFNSLEKFSGSFTVPLQNSAAQDSAAAVPETEPQVSSDLGLPVTFNWCEQNGCTPVRDQGNCGSCWAFATVGPLESLIKINDGANVDLAEQYLVSCNSDGWGCDGGYWAHDYHQWKMVGGELEAGAVLENNFPYQARDVNCNPPHDKAYQITSWEYVCGSYNCRPTTDQIKQAIYDHGPVSASVCVNNAFQRYTGGVFTGPGCSGLNHGVVLVGWDDDDNCWIMRNTWGSNWGESGYMRIRYGVSGIGSNACYVEYGQAPTPDPDPEPEPEPDDEEITNGETLTGLNADRNDWLHFYIDVPEGASNLTVQIWDGTGDADLYTRFGSEPTTSTYECRPYLNGNEETCTHPDPQAGRWHIGVRAYRSFAGVSLTAEFGEGTPEAGPDGQCVTAKNTEHIAQNRAYYCGINNRQACAVGSNDNLGWALNYYSQTSSLTETSPDFWKKTDGCP